MEKVNEIYNTKLFDASEPPHQHCRSLMPVISSIHSRKYCTFVKPCGAAVSHPSKCYCFNEYLLQIKKIIKNKSDANI